jgi:hypothetical protein
MGPELGPLRAKYLTSKRQPISRKEAGVQSWSASASRYAEFFLDCERIVWQSPRYQFDDASVGMLFLVGIAHRKITAIRVVKRERADAGLRIHHHSLSELHTDIFRPQ